MREFLYIYRLDKSCVLSRLTTKLERNSVVQTDGEIIRRCDSLERSSPRHRNRIDRFRMACQFPYGSTCLEAEGGTVLLSSFSYDDETLRFSVPGYVIDFGKRFRFEFDSLLLAVQTPDLGNK